MEFLQRNGRNMQYGASHRGHLLTSRHQVQGGRLKAKELAIAMETLGTVC